MAKKEELLELAQKQSEAVKNAELKAQERAAANAILNKQEATTLKASHEQEANALNQYNTTQYANQGEIIKAAEDKWNTAKQKDETARKRENAFRYISGLGDTLSSVANLVGTAYGAANQRQTYNSNAVVEKAEAARKARKLEMDDLSKRLDEMKARQRDLQAVGSLKEAELKAKQDKEMAALLAAQRKAADEAEYKERQLQIDEILAQAQQTRAEAYEYSKENPKPATVNSRYVKVKGADGTMKDYDVTKFKNFDADYQKALDAAIKDGTSGLSDEEVKAYNGAVKSATTDSGKALKEFLRTHTYLQSVIDRMGSGANNPKYQ